MSNLHSSLAHKDAGLLLLKYFSYVRKGQWVLLVSSKKNSQLTINTQIWVILDKITVQLLIFIDTWTWVQFLRKISVKMCRKLAGEKLAGDNLPNSWKAFSYFYTAKSRFRISKKQSTVHDLINKLCSQETVEVTGNKLSYFCNCLIGNSQKIWISCHHRWNLNCFLLYLASQVTNMDTLYFMKVPRHI